MYCTNPSQSFLAKLFAFIESININFENTSINNILYNSVMYDSLYINRLDDLNNKKMHTLFTFFEIYYIFQFGCK